MGRKIDVFCRCFGMVYKMYMKVKIEASGYPKGALKVGGTWILKI